MSGVVMAKIEEAIVLGVTSGLVGEDTTILDLDIVGKCNAEAVGGCFPSKIMDEELPLGRIEVSEAANLSKDS